MLQYILDGGVMMVPLLALSILAVAVIIDRLRVFRLADVDNDAMRERIHTGLRGGATGEAVQACRDFEGPTAAVMLVGLQSYDEINSRGRARDEVETFVAQSMQDYAPHVLDLLEQRLNILAMVGTAAPLIGMTGTVVGMIMSFNSMAQVGGLDAGAVASGISLALVTTAAGLIIAIPSVIYHNVFSRKVDRHRLQIEESANALIRFIALESRS